MAKRLPTVWPIEPHTLAKHHILRHYLQAWLPIMSSHARRLVYIDGFAGPGVYEDGEPGSPIIALSAFLRHSQRQLITAELIYVFIEEDKKRVERLHEEIAKLGDLPDQVKLDVIHGSYEEWFGKVLDDIEERGKQLAPTFAFVDPFGYTQASMSFTGRFLQFRRCEVLIYVPLPHINRFLSLKSQEPGLNSLFGTTKWMKARELGSGKRVPYLRDLFSRQLKKDCGLSYVRSFDIVSTAGPNAGYTLFFGTNNLERGLLRMKETMWGLDPIAGERFKDTTGQSTLFEEEPDLDPLRDAILDEFGEDSFSIEELERFTIADTPYIPRHLRKPILKPWEQDGRLEIVHAKDKRRRFTFPDGTVMRLNL